MSNKVLYLFDRDYLLHDTGAGHPEAPERLAAVEAAVAPLRSRLAVADPIEADDPAILTVHTRDHLRRVQEACLACRPLDPDTRCCRNSLTAARKAVGAGIVAADALLEAKARYAFCAVRPPGHHATADAAMGFCLFNNIAVVARHLRAKGAAKVAIVDFDVHHGNGTQDIFYDDPSVLYFSTHQSPAYPGTGSSLQKGSGKGYGTTFNFPLPPGSGDEALLPIYRDRLPEILKKFAPDFLLVSAGYDLHRNDPLAQLRVTTEGIAQLSEALLEAADVPALFMLEGGYHPPSLGESVAATIEAMLQKCAD